MSTSTARAEVAERITNPGPSTPTASDSQAAERKRALLVGVNTYDTDGPLSSLSTPANDVRDLAEVLTMEGCSFTAETLNDPTSQELRIAISRLFQEAGKNDLVLFYFSGHGKLNDDGGLALCPKDTDTKYLMATTVSVDFLKQEIDHGRCDRVVIILDCCYSGAAAGAFRSDIPDILKNRLGSGRGKYVISSSSATQLSISLEVDHNGLFSKWLKHGLKTWEADTSGDDIITLDELFNYAKARTTEQRTSQTPTMNGYGVQEGILEIARKPRVEGAPRFDPFERWSHELMRTKTLLYASPMRVIPFLGDGIYGSNELSEFRLTQAIASLATPKGASDPAQVLDPSQPLVTAASYWQEILQCDRDLFLDQFRQIIVEQTRAAALPSVYEWLASRDEPWIAISTTYDVLLEQHLKALGRPFTILAHVLESGDRDFDGDRNRDKILVFRVNPDHAQVQCCSADEIPEVFDECLIYKVLGSPMFAELGPIDPDLDTVVVTESDYYHLFGNLPNEKMGVPQLLGRPLNRNPLLFLGYNLDLWSYRLLVNAFQHRIQGRKALKPMAVRQPQSVIEDLFWKRIGPDMFRMDVATFLRTIDLQDAA